MQRLPSDSLELVLDFGRDLGFDLGFDLGLPFGETLVGGLFLGVLRLRGRLLVAVLMLLRMVYRLKRRISLVALAFSCRLLREPVLPFGPKPSRTRDLRLVLYEFDFDLTLKKSVSGSTDLSPPRRVPPTVAGSAEISGLAISPEKEHMIDKIMQRQRRKIMPVIRRPNTRERRRLESVPKNDK